MINARKFANLLLTITQLRSFPRSASNIVHVIEARFKAIQCTSMGIPCMHQVLHAFVSVHATFGEVENERTHKFSFSNAKQSTSWEETLVLPTKHAVAC